MGNENSKSTFSIPKFPLAKGNTSKHPIYSFLFENPANPMFYCEHYISILYNYQENTKMPSSMNILHTTSQLFDLLYGSCESIPKPIEILDLMIQSTIEKDVIIDNLIKLFEFHKYNQLLRYTSFVISKSFLKQGFFHQKLHDFRGNSMTCTFSSISFTITKMRPLFLNKSINNNDFEKIKSVLNSVQGILPPNEIGAPLPNQFIKKDGQFQKFYAQNVFPHCTTSNGQFLFILTSTGHLNIFPILSNGAILPPFVRKMDFKAEVDHNFSIAASSSYLIIFSSKFKNVYQISDLLNFDCELNYRAYISDCDDILFVISDGILLAELSNDCLIRLFDYNTQTQIFQDSLKFQTLDFHKPISTTPSAINGAFIGFITRVDQSSNIFSVFSLITSEIVAEERFDAPDSFSSITIDSINHCYFCVFTDANGIMEVRKYGFNGSYNPAIFDFSPNLKLYHPKKKITKSNAFKKFTSHFNQLICQLLGSQIIPPGLLADNPNELQGLVDSLQFFSIEIYPELKDKKYYIEILQIIASLIDMNLKYFEVNFILLPDTLIAQIASLISFLPTNIGTFLFFLHFNTFFEADSGKTINLLRTLFENIKSSNLLLFCLRKLEESEILAKIPFSKDNEISILIPQSLESIDKYNRNNISLLYVHQRVLILSTFDQLKLHPYSKSNFNENKDTKSFFDYFYDYSNMLINKLVLALSNDVNIDQLDNSLIFKLFDNFLRLISILSDSHRIAQPITALMTIVLPKLENISKQAHKSHARIQSAINLTYFIFSKFAATLVKGGGDSEFEQKFYWLIKQTLKSHDFQTLKNLSSLKIEDLGDENIISFIKNENSNAMNQLYKSYKPQFNRNLSSELKTVDKIVLVSLCKHMNISNQVFKLENMTMNDKTTIVLSKELKLAMDQMIKIRTLYRKEIQQNNQPTNITQLALILYTLNVNCTNAQQLGSFILSNFPSFLVADIIEIQPSRINITLVGFSILSSLSSMSHNPIFQNCISHCLSQIEDYDGIASILLSTNLSKTQEDKIYKFFSNLLTEYCSTKNSKLILTIFRFFKDVKSILQIQKMVFDETISILNQNKDDYSLFALASLLLRNIKLEFKPKLNNQINWLLLSVSLSENDCSDKLFKKVTNHLWTQHNLSKPICRIIIYSLKSKKLKETTILDFFDKAFKYISDSRSYDSIREVALDIIWLFRRIINEDNASKDFFINYLKKSKSYLAVFMILGLQKIIIRPYCTVQHVSNNNIVTNYISIPNDEVSITCFPLPFDINTPSIDFMRSEVIAYPLVEINYESFSDHNFILSFMDQNSIFSDDISLEYIYYQVLAHFSSFPDFVTNIPKQAVNTLISQAKPLSINYNCAENIIFNISKIKEIDNLNDHFLSIQRCSDENNGYNIYVTHHIIKSSTFEIDISDGYFGIISDTLFPNDVRYELYHFPSGEHYPFNVISATFKTPLQVSINFNEKTFSIYSTVCNFPKGNQFRFLIASKSSFQVKNFDQSSFNEKLIFNTYSIINEDRKTLFNYKEITELPDTMPKYENVEKIGFSIQSLNEKEKYEYSYIKPPISLHILETSSGSKTLINTLRLRCIEYLAGQYSTITLVKIGICQPTLILDPVKLFINIMLFLERANEEKFRNHKFFFELSIPFWEQHSPHHTSLELEAIESVKSIIQDSNTIDKLSIYISDLVSKPHIHTGIYLNSNTELFLKSLQEKSVNGPCLIFMPDFMYTQGFPVFVDLYNSYSLQPHLHCSNLISMNISFVDNSWCFNTVFELLLMMKNFVFLAKTSEHRIIVKSALIDLYISESPIVRPFLLEFLSLIQQHIPSTPNDFNIMYYTKLVMLASYLKRNNNNSQLNKSFLNFYKSEQLILNNPICREISNFFPEFFFKEFQQPKIKKSLFKIHRVLIDPGAINPNNIKDEISLMTHFAKRYSSLVGVPFWEILPYYVRIYRNECNDYLQPEIEKISNTFIIVNNPTRKNVNVKVILSRPMNDAILLYSNSPEFEDVIIISPNEIDQEITLKTRKTYFSINNYEGVWNVIFTQKEVNHNSDFIDIDVQEIHEKFVEDMEMFAVKWSSRDTEILVNSLPKTILENKLFDTVSSIAANCISLTTKYSRIVVILRALLLHHFNYIRSNFYNLVNEDDWITLKEWISNEEASKTLLSSIACNESFREITINRYAAKRLINEGKGDSSNSIIGQLAKQFDKYNNPSLFRNKERPWKVLFTEEKAVDAGGPMRELMTETANSIFLPSSDLFIPIKEFFIPFTNNFTISSNKPSEYRAIGQFVAIIVRTGFPQNLPFAPFVWKFIAGGILNQDDITSVDEEFARNLETVIKNNQSVLWETTNWNGKVVTLPQHPQHSMANISQLNIYVKECIQYRIQTLLPILKEIKTGFVSNIGFDYHPVLSGPLLSYLAQGSNVITVEQLKSITIVIGFDQNEEKFIERFWRSVERFTDDQRHLLLQFITTLTRLPISLTTKFEIKIDKMLSINPDSVLPTASTCFNKLHWPCYTNDDVAYQKLLYSVLNCQTLDLK